jgi:signal transduction histidine kinase
VVWLPDNTTIGRALPEDLAPLSNPATSYFSQKIDNFRYLVVSSDFSNISLIHTIYVDVSVLENQVAQLSSQSMIMLIITFLALSAGGHLLISHVQRPIKEFLDDVGPFANYDFDKPFRKVNLPEIADITYKMEEIRSKLAHYKRINVEQVILQEHRNRLLMTYATEMVAQYDQKRQFIFLNDQFNIFLQEIGIKSNNVSIEDLLNNDHVIIRDKKSEITSRDYLIINSQNIEIELTADLGKVYYLQLHLNDITDHNDNHLGGLLLINDQTRSREIERMRTEMINLIVHELQNPVSAGLGLTSYLLEESQIDENERKDVLAMIKLSMDKITSMIERFLAIARLESVNVRIDKAPVDLNLLLKPIVDSFKSQILERNIHLVVNEEPTPVIMGSYDLIEDVFRNLISNGIKYGGENRTIIISLWSDGQHVFFSVTDHSYGIPDEYMDKIFHKFFRIQAYNMEKGTGLGLSYVKEVMKKHHGEIKVESNPQIGTKFTVSFAIKEDLY